MKKTIILEEADFIAVKIDGNEVTIHLRDYKTDQYTETSFLTKKEIYHETGKFEPISVYKFKKELV